MDKPVSLSVKHWIIRQMSVKTFVQENIIETVVNHQFDAAYVALEKCESLEFSGFGRFYFNRKKGIKKLEKMKDLMTEWNRLINDPSTLETKRKSVEYKLKIITKEFEYLNTKLNGTVQDLRGLEKQPVSPKEIKETDSEDQQGENGNMQEM